MRLRTLLMILFLAGAISGIGQESFYDPAVIREIRIRFKEHNWRYILDSLFTHEGDDGKLTGEVTVEGHAFENAGIRYKGYSSYNANSLKNPFNIDLDYPVKNRNYQGFVKFKLSNVIQDPSFIREVLSYEIARKYMPVSHANFARLYINDTLIGLYTNVEAVDKKFIAKRWVGNDNSFFKGEPAVLQYPFGQNANLALTHGTDTTGYMPYYNRESNAGWNDLYRFIYLLDKGADSVAPVLNTDRALWMHAFNETLLNLDSYIGYSQNYYIYRDNNGQFNPILWDMNMSFGSFRDSDASRHFQGITIPQIKRLDPLALMSFAVSPRPLMTRLFANDTLKKIYFAHIRTILDENIRNGSYYTRGAEIQALIDADVAMDVNKFYPYSDFKKNLDTTVGGTGSMVLYPGIRELMEARMAYLDSVDGYRHQPVITEVAHTPDIPVKNEPVWITAKIAGAGMAYLGYRFKTGGIFTKITMYDDGNHHDGTAGDGVYGAMFTVAGHTIQYYIYAGNDLAGSLSPERAEYEFYSIQPALQSGDIVLNEVQTVSYINGWIEIFNTTSEPLQAGGMRISDDPDVMDKWILSDTVIPAKGYCVVQNDQLMDKQSGMPLANSAAGGRLCLANAQGSMVDSVSFGQQVKGKSFGRFPNGYGKFAYMPATPGQYNRMATTPSSGFNIFPNPASDELFVELPLSSVRGEIQLFNATGVVAVNRYFGHAHRPATAETRSDGTSPRDLFRQDHR